MTDDSVPDLALPSSPFAGPLARAHKQAEMEARLFGAAAVAPIRIGRYTVLRKLGAGGMSVVYVAYDEQLDRKVAVKFLRSPGSGQQREQTKDRLQREARAMARLSHPNVAAVHEIGEQDGELYLVMELVDGPSLRGWLGEPRATASVLEVLTGAARGIAAAHDAGVIHRDIKPDNVVVGSTVKVIDFGIASTVTVDLAATDPHGEAIMSAAPASTRTVAGTPQYMAPEQFGGAPSSHLTDQFSFCVTAWEALLGVHPFPFDSRSRPEELGDPQTGSASIDRRVLEALRRGLCVDPQARHPSMQALIDAFLPARRASWAWGVAGAVALGSVGLAMFSDSPQTCTGAEDALGSAWDHQRRQDVEHAFAGQSAYGEATWTAVAPRLDRYAQLWMHEHREACLSGDRGEQSSALVDDRMRCLDGARRALEQSTSLLAAASDEQIESALPVVEALPALDRCSDLEALAADVADPTPEQAAEVAASRASLAKARALQIAGAYDEAEATLAAIRGPVEALGFDPLTVETQLFYGEVLLDQGRYDEAATVLAETLRLAMTQRQWLEAYDASLELAMLDGYHRDRKGSGEAWLTTARGVQRHAGSDPVRLAALHRTRAAIARRAGDYAAARVDLESALSQLTAVDGAVTSRAVVLDQLSMTVFRLGHIEDSLALRRRAIDLMEAELGPLHPSSAVLHENLAGVLTNIGRLDEAARELDGALKVETKAWGPDNPRLLQARMTRVQLLRAQGEPAEAEIEARAVLQARRRVLGPKHLDTLMTQSALAVTLAMQAKFEEAEPLLGDAVRALIETAGPRHAATMAQQHNYAMLLSRLGRFTEAEVEIRRLLAARREELGPEHQQVLGTWSLLAGVLAELDRQTEAAAEYQQAIALFEPALPPDHRELAAARLDYGTLLYELNDHAESKRVLERAWGYFGRDDVAPQRQAEVIYALALVSTALGDESQAVWIDRAREAHATGAMGPDRWKILKQASAAAKPHADEAPR